MTHNEAVLMTHNQAISELKEKELLDDIPVNLENISRAYRIVVETKFIYKLSGKISKIKNTDRYIIHVNVLHPRTRQRFTLSHELAHFFLHKEKIGDGIQDDALYRSELQSALEVQANRLASEIIMPKHTIQQRVQEYLSEGYEINQRLAEDLARDFEVSPVAMKIRIGL